jgi:U4/U6.U5 tri-snRNP-associated protein 1
LDELDSAFDDDAPRAKPKQYTSKQLTGLKIAHSLNDIAEEQDQILTLRDVNILAAKDGKHVENDAEDTLEDVHVSEAQRRQVNKELSKKKPRYNAYDDKPEDILAKYDEEARITEEKSFRLGVDDVKASAAARAERAEQLSKQLNQLDGGGGKVTEAGAIQYDLSYEKGVASDYFTKEEMAAKFRKRKVDKDKKKLKKPV